MLSLVDNSNYYIIYKNHNLTHIYIYISCFKFSTTHTGKGYDSQILFLGIIYYNIVSYAKFEGECREYFRQKIKKVRI